MYFAQSSHRFRNFDHINPDKLPSQLSCNSVYLSGFNYLQTENATVAQYQAEAIRFMKIKLALAYRITESGALVRSTIQLENCSPA